MVGGEAAGGEGESGGVLELSLGVLTREATVWENCWAIFVVGRMTMMVVQLRQVEH